MATESENPAVVMDGQVIASAATAYSSSFRLARGENFSLEGYNNSAGTPNLDVALEYKSYSGSWVTAAGSIMDGAKNSLSEVLTSTALVNWLMSLTAPYFVGDFRIAVTNDDAANATVTLLIHRSSSYRYVR